MRVGQVAHDDDGNPPLLVDLLANLLGEYSQLIMEVMPVAEHVDGIFLPVHVVPSPLDPLPRHGDPVYYPVIVLLDGEGRVVHESDEAALNGVGELVDCVADGNDVGQELIGGYYAKLPDLGDLGVLDEPVSNEGGMEHVLGTCVELSSEFICWREQHLVGRWEVGWAFMD